MKNQVIKKSILENDISKIHTMFNVIKLAIKCKRKEVFKLHNVYFQYNLKYKMFWKSWS